MVNAFWVSLSAFKRPLNNTAQRGTREGAIALCKTDVHLWLSITCC